MSTAKTETLAVRISHCVKEAIRLAPEAERRPIINLIEVMIFERCEKQGLDFGDEITKSAKE